MSERISANGITMTYALDGPSDASVVMFSATMMCHHTIWDKQVSALVPQYRVLRYDARGHGGSDATTGPYTLDLLADDAVALLEALDIETAHFVGLSFGGFIDQALACRHPGVVTSLVLCDTACQMPPESMWDDRIETVRREGVGSFPELMIQRWFTDAYRDANPHEMEPIKKMIGGMSIDGMIGSCHAVKNMNHAPILKDIKSPTLIIVGEHDISTPLAVAEVLHNGIEGSEFRIIEGAAHVTNFEQPEQFNAVLLEFLNRN